MLQMLLPHELQAMKLGVTNPQFQVFNEPVSVIPYLPAWSRIEQTPRVKGHNDLVGDCVETGACNIVQTLLARQNRFTALPDDLPVELYADITGFNPSDPATDKGTDINQFFSWWQQNTICGFKLDKATPINPKDEALIRSTIEKNGAIMTIMGLALEQQNQKIWSASGTPGSWGYHCGVYDSYDGELYSLTTWGLEQLVDRSYFNQGFVSGVFNIELLVA